MAESVVEVVFERCGWTSVWHFIDAGRHGVALLLRDDALESEAERSLAQRGDADDLLAHTDHLE